MVPCLVVRLNEPLVRTATLPTYVPCLVPFGTTARTKSPVWNPYTRFACLGPVRGKPNRSMRHICREPCPIAWMHKGTTPFTVRGRGVLAPTHAASNQCILGNPRITRLYLVRPPLPHSMGRPNADIRSKSAHRVALTAAI